MYSIYETLKIHNLDIEIYMTSLISIVPLSFIILLYRTPFWESITENWTFTAEYFSYFIPFVLWIIITQTFAPFLVRYKVIN